MAQFVLTKRIEAPGAYLSYQLKTYQDAARVAAQLATLPDDDPARAKAVALFWKFYCGEPVLVEDPKVEAHMKRFKDGMEGRVAHLPSLAYCLSHAVRGSLARSWDVPDWEFARYIPAESCEDFLNAK